MRTARVGLRVSGGQRRRCFALLVSAGDVWACVLDMNWWRRHRGLPAIVGYQALCRELSAAGPGTFGELNTVGARSVLRRYSDAWFATAARRKDGDVAARFPRRKRRLMPLRYYHGTFTLEGLRLRLPVRDAKYRRRAVARRAPKPGQAGSRRWRKHRARQRKVEARHRRRVRQAQHEAAKTVVDWAVARRAGTLVVGDPRGVLTLKAGRRHNRRVRDWRIGYLIRCLKDKAEQAGIDLMLVDERGTSSTCPACRQRVLKPTNRNFTCTRCGFNGHRDLVGGANIARRGPGGTITTNTSMFPVVITHRRAGRHLPGAGRSRRDPRRSPHHGTAQRVPWPAVARPTTRGESLAQSEDQPTPPPNEANVD